MLHVQPEPPAAVGVMPEGNVSLTVTCPDVASVPILFAVIV